MLRSGHELIAAAIKDPNAKELTFDRARQHELMIREWRKIYDQYISKEKHGVQAKQLSTRRFTQCWKTLRTSAKGQRQHQWRS